MSGGSARAHVERGATRKARLTPDTLAALRFVSHPSVAPGGRHAAYVVSEVVPARGDEPPRYRHRIRLIDLDSGHDRTLTQGESDRAPRWSDASTLSFLSPPRGARDLDRAQLHVIAIDGGEAKVRTDFECGVLEHRPLAEGRGWIATVRAAGALDPAAGGLGRVVERRMHKRDGSGFVDQRPVELWLVPPDAGPARRAWRFEQEPSELVLTPDGRHLVYLAPADDDEADMGLHRMWLRPLRGGRALDLLGRASLCTDPSVAPDGRTVAYFEHHVPTSFGAPQTLWTVAIPGGDDPPAAESVPRTRDLEAKPSTAGDSRLGSLSVAPCWSDDGGTLIVAVNRAGRASVARVERDGRVTDLHAGDHVVTAFDSRAGRTVAVVETRTRPGQLHLLERDGSERVLTGWNDELLSAHALGRPRRERSFTARDGQELAYWRLSPPRPRRDRAVVVQVHGGPHTNYGYGFVFEFHLLASAGYEVVYGNPRGGSSYGEAFGTAITGAYGTVDAADVLDTVDDALAQLATPDAPVHLTGGSYGGFMTNWLVAHTDRFRSAVTQRSICNWLSFYGTSDIGPPFTEAELLGRPWSDHDALWRMSPLRYVDAVSTPTLVLHAEQDHRCPMEQAEQWFTALKRLGKAPTRLIRFPDEGHELSRAGRPDRRVQRLEAILGWFQEHA